uniref:Mannosyl-glycoprotein endo-beta-N-acetylglucosaminidase n=1 Tax=Macrostomum lignano TaxID=282301 RepID=A0A1I8FS77_9PLAT
KAMRQLLSNEKDAIGWADRLIDLADAGGFDGWLINVENSVNALNEDFLIAAGSILLNYCWTADLLKSTASRLAKLQSPSSSTLTVYVGVDCFGRGCLRRRRLQLLEAVRMMFENQQLGVGLFRAPAWAYETCAMRRLNQTKLMETPRTFGRVGSRPPWCRTNAWKTALWEGAPDAALLGCAVAEQHLSLCRSRAWQGAAVYASLWSGGVAAASAAMAACGMPLFRLSLARVDRSRALKLVVLVSAVAGHGSKPDIWWFLELCAGKLKRRPHTASRPARLATAVVVWHTVLHARPRPRFGR